MKIKVLQSFSVKGEPQEVGSIIELSDDEARSVINSNFAVEVKDTPRQDGETEEEEGQ